MKIPLPSLKEQTRLLSRLKALRNQRDKIELGINMAMNDFYGNIMELG